MKKITLLVLVSMTLVSSILAQYNPQYFQIEIYANSAKINPASKIFDECYAIGYNSKGQLLYGHTGITEAADHNEYAIVLYNVTTKKEQVLIVYAMEDTMNSYNTFDDFFKANKKKIATYLKKYNLLNKQPTISLIAKNDYTLVPNCKKEYEWYNCTYKATYKKAPSFGITTKGQPSKNDKPILYKLLSFAAYNIILYNTTQRGWEGTPYVINYGLH